MHTTEWDLEILASKARDGDRDAGVALHRALEPQLPFLVRQALRDPDSPFAEQVRGEARQVAAASPPGRDSPEFMIGQVVRRMSDFFWRLLVVPESAERWHMDTLQSA